MSSEKPIYVLNMLKFKARAEYPEGSQFAGANLSGEEAYAEYGKAIRPLIQKAQAQFSVRWDVEATHVGQSNTQWDQIFVVRYPSVSAFRNMINSDEYRAVVEHRTAAVEDSWAIQMSNQQLAQPHD